MRGFIKTTIETAAEYFGVSPDDITGTDRTGPMCEKRFAVYLICRRAGYSFSVIGRHLNRDHTSVSSGCLRAIEMERVNPEFSNALSTIENVANRNVENKRRRDMPRFVRHGHKVWSVEERV